jgi:tetratricopeptide (TPR) repeat protein
MMRPASLLACGTLLLAISAAFPAAAQTETGKLWETCTSTTGTGATRLPACTDLIEKKLVEGRKLAGAYCIRGNDLTEKGELDAALADVNRAIEIDATYACAFINRGRIYRLKSDPDRAIADYDEAIKIDPRMVLAWNNRGDAYIANAAMPISRRGISTAPSPTLIRRSRSRRAMRSPTATAAMPTRANTTTGRRSPTTAWRSASRRASSPTSIVAKSIATASSSTLRSRTSRR